MTYYDFNTADKGDNFDLIPKGTIAKVSLKIRPGGYNDLEQGWTGGYATKSQISEAIYLNCEFTIIDGEYKWRKVWNLIGLYSSKNDNSWGAIGRGFIRSILNSAKGFSDKDDSVLARNARKIEGFAALDSLEFAAKIDVTEDANGNLQNIIKTAIDKRHVDYSKVMGLVTIDKPSWV